ncbi:hypothetical protein BJ138DRAFT_1116634 [Hygrophoropsis aurantiaca]|uniref:Uncharacterized protein n=1 Tax=Hygrophoropsis aurantiaca TaxID=72124 RepID=A0ACB8A237_9AGAM|nr:hypothetical protein BJ138DRAFT_1116634 [Hygrophoropsis aurantiaca]
MARGRFGGLAYAACFPVQYAQDFRRHELRPAHPYRSQSESELPESYSFLSLRARLTLILDRSILNITSLLFSSIFVDTPNTKIDIKIRGRCGFRMETGG